MPGVALLFFHYEEGPLGDLTPYLIANTRNRFHFSPSIERIYVRATRPRKFIHLTNSYPPGAGIGQVGGPMPYVFYKHPDERFAIAIEFEGLLPPGAQEISSAAVTAIDLEDSSDATAIVIHTPTAEVFEGTEVRWVVKAGTTAKRYRIKVVSTTDTGQDLVDLIDMEIREALTLL